MKKRTTHIIWLLIALLCLLGLTAGLKSCDSSVRLPSYDQNITIDPIDEVSKVNSLIKAIKTPITLDSNDQITLARNAYNSLSDQDKDKVTLYDKLLEYEKQFAELKDNANKELDLTTAEGLNKFLNTIDTTNPDIDSLAKIRLAYEQLNDSQKSKFNLKALEKLEASLTNLSDYLNNLLKNIKLPLTDFGQNLLKRIRSLADTLSDLEKTKFNFAELEKYEVSLQEPNKDIESVINMIDAISLPISLESEKVIENALNSYNSLNQQDKIQVTNYNKLLEYINQLNALKQNNDSELPPTGVE